MEKLVDKTSIMQVFGCLMKDPLLFAQIDKYHLDIIDFPDRFQKIIFSSLINMFSEGVRVITPLDIDNYLNSYQDLKKIYENNNGLQYIQDCEEIGELSNFNYYYQRVKKFSALRALRDEGFDISSFYCEDILNVNYTTIQERFDTLTVADIFSEIKKKLFAIEEKYVVSNDGGGASLASGGLRQLKEQYKIVPEIGIPLQGVYYNSAVRGARKGKYYLRSAGSGMGKTRLMVGDACNISIPIYYDTYQKKWVEKEFFEKSLIITTELDKDEIQTMILAWISGVNEDKILNGNYFFDEESRVDKAIEIVEKYEDYLILEKMPDPSITQVEATIRKQCLVNNVENVFYDYIFSSPSLLNEYASLKIREDIILMMLSTSLKDLASELNVFMQSSTQLSGDFKGKRGIKDQSLLRGSKAVADKVDVGVITTWIEKEERDIIETVANKLNCQIPNYVTDIYKARRSKYKNIKIWSKVDLGTCRMVDLFATDEEYNLIEDFEILIYENDKSKCESSKNEEKEKNDVIEEKKETKKRRSLEDF